MSVMEKLVGQTQKFGTLTPTTPLDPDTPVPFSDAMGMIDKELQKSRKLQEELAKIEERGADSAINVWVTAIFDETGVQTAINVPSSWSFNTIALYALQSLRLEGDRPSFSPPSLIYRTPEDRLDLWIDHETEERTMVLIRERTKPIGEALARAMSAYQPSKTTRPRRLHIRFPFWEIHPGYSLPNPSVPAVRPCYVAWLDGEPVQVLAAVNQSLEDFQQHLRAQVPALSHYLGSDISFMHYRATGEGPTLITTDLLIAHRLSDKPLWLKVPTEAEQSTGDDVYKSVPYILPSSTFPIGWDLKDLLQGRDGPPRFLTNEDKLPFQLNGVVEVIRPDYECKPPEELEETKESIITREGGNVNVSIASGTQSQYYRAMLVSDVKALIKEDLKPFLDDIPLAQIKLCYWKDGVIGEFPSGDDVNNEFFTRADPCLIVRVENMFGVKYRQLEAIASKLSIQESKSWMEIGSLDLPDTLDTTWRHDAFLPKPVEGDDATDSEGVTVWYTIAGHAIKDYLTSVSPDRKWRDVIPEILQRHVQELASAYSIYDARRVAGRDEEWDDYWTLWSGKKGECDKDKAISEGYRGMGSRADPVMLVEPSDPVTGLPASQTNDPFNVRAVVQHLCPLMKKQTELAKPPSSQTLTLGLHEVDRVSQF